MSKVGRKPIPVGTAQVEVNGKIVTIKNAKKSVTHVLPDEVSCVYADKQITLAIASDDRKSKMLWGLHRALLANNVQGLEKGFEESIKIVGLGYKAQQEGRKLTFSLGYSHKKEYTLPEGVDVTIDRSGQNLIFKGTDKFILGNVCDGIRSLRPPEPYKGTGILRNNEVIIRKAGKTKA
ncbi:50S ribosomal protein L6 [Candidatus Babeliales bacterium]|nr:50S ribosomal protein L6 [Candidatus Babeliales bacterium]